MLGHDPICSKVARGQGAKRASQKGCKFRCMYCYHMTRSFVRCSGCEVVLHSEDGGWPCFERYHSKAFDEHCWAHLGVAKATFQEDMRDPDCTALIAKCKRGRPRVVKPGPPRAPAAYIQADHNNARQAGLYVLSVAELRSTSVNKTI
jgi:hypothetical protein